MSDPAKFDYTPFDALLAPDGPVMIVGQQFLRPAAMADDEIIFPPSYANPSEKKDDPPVYNIDYFDPANPSKNVCVLDSVSSQANRMEPLFGLSANRKLVPQYSIKFADDAEPVSILQVGHRLADAVFRGTTLHGEIVSAFKTYAQGNAVPIAKIGPTSIVFGVWDSRSTGVKVPRLINSIIRAFDVKELKRSAQYSPPIKYEQQGLIPAGLAGKPSDHGLADVPSTHKIGGVQINGDIRRSFSLNLATLRSLKGANEEEAISLKRYILGLSLLALTATPEVNYRQGCQLLPKGKVTWKQFFATGDESDWSPEDISIAHFAQAAAKDFRVSQPANQPLLFDKDLLKSSIEADAKRKADNKKASNEPSIDTLAQFVGALKVSSNGVKLNDAPVKKLNECLDSIKEGPLMETAKRMKETIDGVNGPQSKIDLLNQIVENAKSLNPATSAASQTEAQPERAAE